MNLKLLLSRAFLFCAICVAGFAWIAVLVAENEMFHFDETVANFIQQFESPMLTAWMKFFTFIGSTPSVIAISLIAMLFLYKVLRHRRELTLFVIVVAGAAILNQILKVLFHRARPNVHRLIEITGYSFPSGHSMTAFALYGVLIYLLWRHLGHNWQRLLAVLIGVFLILAIGVSRIYLGVHYPSDVVAGYLASGFWLGAVILIDRQLMQRRKRNIR